MSEQNKSGKSKPLTANPFHDHLDRCKQCADQPFNLCPVGAKLLSDAVSKP